MELLKAWFAWYRTQEASGWNTNIPDPPLHETFEVIQSEDWPQPDAIPEGYVPRYKEKS